MDRKPLIKIDLTFQKGECSDRLPACPNARCLIYLNKQP